MAKLKTAKKRTNKKDKYAVGQVKDDAKQRRKYAKGGRVEAYTWGEVSGKKGSNWPF